MGWNDNMNRNTVDDIEDLSYPPSGGRVKMIVLGILLPLVIGYFAARAWMTQEAVWLGERGATMIVKGVAAKALGVCYFGAAGFCHFRWFWGLVPAYRVFTIGIVLSMILGLGGCGTACYYVFR